MTQTCPRLSPLLVLLAVPWASAQVVTEPGATSGTSEDYFAAASLAFQQQDYAAARDGFQAALELGSDGPAALYNLAVSQYRLGEYANAEQSFRALGSQFPQMRSLADYNIGLSLVRLEQPQRARSWFERAAQADDLQIAGLAEEMLARLPVDSVPPRPAWLRYVDVSFGSDDNVALVDPLALPAGQSTDSTFGEFQFYLSGPIGSTDRWRLTANAFLLQYADADDYNQQLFDMAARYEHEFSGWQLAAGPRVGRIHIDGDGFEQTVGGLAEVRYPLEDAAAALKLGFSYELADELGSEYAYIDGHQRQVLAGIEGSSGRVRWIVDFRLVRDHRAGAGVSADRKLLSSRMRRSFGPDWTGDLVLEFRDTDYDQLVPARQEQRQRIGLLASRNLGAGMSLSIRYWHSDNDASDPLYSYSRQRLSLGLSWLF